MASLDLRPTDGWVGRFGLMLGLSVLVAVMGLSADSAALVIGAMLLAPLMTPVMGLAAAMALAFPRRILRLLATVTIASVSCVVLAWLVALILPAGGLTSEVLARTSPDIRDLVVGLAAGTAGAYATVRPEVSASLPGVAVAVALVPPLGAAGMAFEAGRSDLAGGALLLYLANLTAIVLASVLVFLLTGLVPRRRLATTSPRVVAGSVLATLATIAAAVPLTLASVNAAETAQAHAKVDRAVLDWLQGTGAELDDISFAGETVIVRVSGANEPIPTEPLNRSVAAVLGGNTRVEVRWTQTMRPPETTPAPAEDDQEEIRAEQVADVVSTWLVSADVGGFLEVTAVRLSGTEEVRVELSGPETPPPSDQLAAALYDVLGTTPRVVVEWTQTTLLVDGDRPSALEEARARLSGALSAWASGTELVVAGLRYDGDKAVIDLVGPEPIDPAEVAQVVADAVGAGVTVEVWFTQRRLLASPTPIPAPTPAPTPAPSPTPGPEPEPSPTPS